MAEKTLYDVLEVSATASPESIRAAYERLSAKFDPDRSENASNPGAKIQYDAVKEAFLTLGNAEKRKQYDVKLVRARSVLQNVEVVEPFWTLPKVIVLGIVLLASGGFYYNHQKQQAQLARVAAEKAIAEAKAKEAEEQARAEAETARAQASRQRQQQIAEDRQRRESDAALRQFSREQKMYQTQDRHAQERERRDKEMAERRVENQRRLDEQRAHQQAQAQLAREKAELCRMERERYGKAISC